MFSNFSVTGDQTWKKRKNGTSIGFERNFLSPALLTLELAERVPIDPLSLYKSSRKPGSKN